ncbi:uncharacterized protein A1O5_05632 [Cladophialophora psammophila CBS 110553]|uniref:3-oxoacyl-[acyl-carrier protein] reductase n=1 Tax=Cladophialophora psammophila CBS 110553 TaxID=1182543 RepID=W9WUE7_9EURO|nr:uncharacterized protein A1O5_05632 [Cladophialophora psammophila CBS 110553]EXJ71822.1 hypothetical protein A1O5_05632 [Cladophialophora psammophila CBS 110553]
MPLGLKGSALVTGAGGGIGRACVEQLLRDGCERLVISDIHKDSLQETARLAKKINPEAEVVVEAGDIGLEQTAQSLVDIAVKNFGRLDYGLNVAGVAGELKPIVDISTKGYDFVQDINAKSVWLCERAQIKQMLKQEPLPTQLSEMAILLRNF